MTYGSDPFLTLQPYQTEFKRSTDQDTDPHGETRGKSMVNPVSPKKGRWGWYKKMVFTIPLQLFNIKHCKQERLNMTSHLLTTIERKRTGS